MRLLRRLVCAAIVCAAVEQLDLFGDRTVLLEAARRAADEGKSDEVRARGSELLVRYPDDPSLLRDVGALTEAISPFERAASLPAKERAEVLLEALRTAPPSGAMRATLLRSIAAALSDAGGEVALVDGLPAGHFLALAGDLDGAENSLRRAILAQPSARITAFLADVLSLRGDHATAHPLFLRALLDSPHDVPFGALQDAEIGRLPTTAEMEIEIDEDPIAWAGPVALVTGVLTTTPTLFPLPIEIAENARLAGPRAFVEAMMRAHSPDDDGVAARRTMKRLCSPLFAVYLERRVRHRRG